MREKISLLKTERAIQTGNFTVYIVLTVSFLDNSVAYIFYRNDSPALKWDGSGVLGGCGVLSCAGNNSTNDVLCG